jgi:predicted Zn-dependent peptidase
MARFQQQRRQSSVQARNQLWALLLGPDHPEARSPYGDSASVAGITSVDLQSHRARLCDGRRVWIAVSAGIPQRELIDGVQTMLESAGLTHHPMERCEFDRDDMRETRSHLGSLAHRRFAEAYGALEQEPATGSRTLAVRGGGAQACVIEALLLSPTDSLPAPGSENEAAARIATSAASSRIAFDIREKLGLAYGVGAGLAPIGDRWLYTASAGTRPPGIAAVAAGFVRGRRGVAATQDPQALQREANVLYGTALRRQESRINQAMEAVLAVRAGKGPLDWWTRVDRFRGVDRAIVAGALHALATADSSLILIAR